MFTEIVVGALYVVGMFCALALYVSAIRERIKNYNRFHSDVPPPEILWAVPIAILWPVGLVVAFGVGIGVAIFWFPAKTIWKVIVLAYNLGMSEPEDIKRALRGRFWKIRAKIEREETV